MNRFALAGAVLVTACLPLAARAQKSESGSASLAPFRPGLTWNVEELPPFQKILFRVHGGARPDMDPPAAASKGRVVEENTILAEGFRKQVLPGDQVTRYIKGGLVVAQNSAGTEFFIESLDPDLARDRISSNRLLEFAWIAPRWKIGVAPVDGVECEVFARPWPVDAATENSDAAKAEVRPDQWIYAAVGRSDRLPRRLESPVAVRRYHFTMTNPPPELPAGAVLAIHRMNESAKEMAQRYAVPQ